MSQRKTIILLILFVFTLNYLYSSDTTKYRSFTPADLISETKSIKKKAYATEWCFRFVNTTDSLVNGLYFESGQSVVTFVNYSPFTNNYNPTPDKKKWQLSGGIVNPGDTIYIRGTGLKKGMKINKWYWTFDSVRVGIQNRPILPVEQRFLLPMPNIVNVGEEVFKFGGYPSGMIVGISISNNTQLAWVRLKKWKDIPKTLVDKSGLHIGNPRGFKEYHNQGTIKGEKKCLPPVKYSNRLYAGVIALKFNITASAMIKIPNGFGELVYDDGTTNPLNGLMIKDIAIKADSALTFWNKTSDDFYLILDQTIERINSAFNGPIDTVSFGRSTELSGIKPVSEVLFLHNSSKKVEPARIVENLGQNSQSINKFSLYQNYPNPFNPTTQIEFDLEEASIVTLKVFDILGREIAKLADSEFEEGYNCVEFNAENLSAGVYFYSILVRNIETGHIIFNDSKKMILTK